MKSFREFGDLSDGEIKLVLKSIDEPNIENEISLRYGFSIIHIQDNEDIGIIYFAADKSDRQYLRGHLSYGVSPAYSGHNYAAKACMLLKPVISMHGFTSVFIGAKNDNIASIRTIEKIGAQPIAIDDIPHPTVWDTLQEEQVTMYLWKI